MNVEGILNRLASALRKALVKISYRDVVLGPNVFLEAGARIRTFDGGRVEIGENCDIHAGALIEARRGVVVIGSGAVINRWSSIVAGDRIEIGKDALIAESVVIRDQNHSRATKPYSRAGMVGAPIAIGPNVWIGAKATVLAGVTLPADTVVGAGAVVTRSPPSAGLLVGVPARLKTQAPLGT